MINSFTCKFNAISNLCHITIIDRSIFTIERKSHVTLLLKIDVLVYLQLKEKAMW